MKRLDGPTIPPWPRRLVHPLGPLFLYLPLVLRRHLLYLATYGRWGNFSSPRYFSEKMQWRILNDRRELLSWTCDKLASKEYARRVARSSGIALQVPRTLWFGTDVRSLQSAVAAGFPARWVLKPNHSCGRLRIVDSSAGSIDWGDIAEVLPRWTERDEEERVLGHWSYGQARHVVFAEEFVDHALHGVVDFKVLGFGGKVETIIVQANASDLKVGSLILDRGFRPKSNSTAAQQLDLLAAVERLGEKERQSILTIAELLIAPFDQMRVDLYVQGGSIGFGELSAYHSSGLKSPAGSRLLAAADLERGNHWVLPDLTAPDARRSEWASLLSEDPTIG